MTTRYLIVNADDLGYTPGVTEGIIRAHHKGIVTSTSVLINASAAADGVRQALQETPNLGLGLHLTLTSGKPLSPADEIPDLIQPDGTFYRPGTLVPLLAEIDMAQVEREMRAQVALFTEVAGHGPDHLDSHHHITYATPSMVSLMLDIARELSIPVRHYFPDPANMQPGILTPDRFLDRFYDERATLGDLLNILVDVPEGFSELMCHPAVVDDALRASSDYSERRGDELAVLTHPSVRELIAAEGIELVSFGYFLSAGGVA
jgi:predicted glycoside hydrolase/deacetylase ChbG (UPF0249 family)